MAARTFRSGDAGGARLRSYAQWLDPFTIGFGLFILLPTMLAIARQSWSSESGAHGPIVLATGLWLLFHDRLGRDGTGDARISWVAILAGLVLAIPVYAFGRAYDFLFVEAAAAYAVFVVWLYRHFGWNALVRHAFPIFYLAFLIPLPGALLAAVTGPLQMLVSSASAAIVDAAGYPIARHGVSLYVAQYQLLVEDACAGLNSLIGLIAISLFYIYLLHRESWRYALVLVGIIIPVAIIVNMIRVVALILITYHYGDAAAQGFLHDTTGFVLFAAALVLVFAIDQLLRRFRRRAA